MSGEAMKWALAQRTRSASQKAVLLVLAWRAFPKRTQGPHIVRCSAKSLAQSVDASRSTVERALGYLERAGLVVPVERAPARGRHGSFVARVYRLAMRQPDTRSMQQPDTRTVQQPDTATVQQPALHHAADCASTVLHDAALLESDVEVEDGETEQHAARVSAIRDAEDRWRNVQEERGGTATAVTQSGRRLLERLAAEDLPAGVLGDLVAAVTRRQRVIGNPVRHFRYLERGALEDELRRWRADGDRGAEFESYRNAVLDSLRNGREDHAVWGRLPGAVVECVREELEAATSLAEVKAVRLAVNAVFAREFGDA